MFYHVSCVVPHFNGSAYKLAISDGWTLVGDGWANACPDPPLAMPVVIIFIKSMHALLLNVSVSHALHQVLNSMQ